jgi:hypothetical protein
MIWAEKCINIDDNELQQNLYLQTPQQIYSIKSMQDHKIETLGNSQTLM